MWQFKTLVNRRHSLALGDYEDLWKWSIENLSQFWALVWDFVEIQSSVLFTSVSGRARNRQHSRACLVVSVAGTDEEQFCYRYLQPSQRLLLT